MEFCGFGLDVYVSHLLDAREPLKRSNNLDFGVRSMNEPGSSVRLTHQVRHRGRKSCLMIGLWQSAKRLHKKEQQSAVKSICKINGAGCSNSMRTVESSTAATLSSEAFLCPEMISAAPLTAGRSTASPDPVFGSTARLESVDKFFGCQSSAVRPFSAATQLKYINRSCLVHGPRSGDPGDNPTRRVLQD